MYLIFIYVPETHLKEVPQVQRDLYERFQHSPLIIIYNLIKRLFNYCNCNNNSNNNNNCIGKLDCTSFYCFFSLYSYFCAFFSRRFNKGYKYTDSTPLEANIHYIGTMNNNRNNNNIYKNQQLNIVNNSHIQLSSIHKNSNNGSENDNENDDHNDNDNSTFNDNDACVLGLGFHSISEDSEDLSKFHNNNNSTFEVIQL